MQLLWILCAVLLVGVGAIKTGGSKARQGLLKVPETLSLAATAYADVGGGYADYNMISDDPHHVSYIVQNRLYYHRIPHQRIVLNQEDVREMNGLPRHLLESIRPFFPFFVDY